MAKSDLTNLIKEREKLETKRISIEASQIERERVPVPVAEELEAEGRKKIIPVLAKLGLDVQKVEFVHGYSGQTHSINVSFKFEPTSKYGKAFEQQQKIAKDARADAAVRIARLENESYRLRMRLATGGRKVDEALEAEVKQFLTTPF